MKRNIFYIICLSIVTDVFSQYKNNSTPLFPLFITNYQRLLFITVDSTYQSTKFIEQTGFFYFNARFVDSLSLHNSRYFNVSTKHKPTLSGTEHMFKYIPNVDTLFTYFLVKGKEYYRNSIKNLINDVEASYVLKQLGEPFIESSNQNTIRILEPCDELNLCNSYRVYTIKLFTDSAKFYVTLGQSIDYNGMQLIKKDSCLLKKNEIEKLKRQLTEISNVSDTLVCREPGNPWIFEYNNGSEYKRYIISYLCLHDNRIERKYFFPLTILFETIRWYNKKYFNIDCPAPH